MELYRQDRVPFIHVQISAYKPTKADNGVPWISVRRLAAVVPTSRIYRRVLERLCKTPRYLAANSFQHGGKENLERRTVELLAYPQPHQIRVGRSRGGVRCSDVVQWPLLRSKCSRIAWIGHISRRSPPQSLLQGAIALQRQCHCCAWCWPLRNRYRLRACHCGKVCGAQPSRPRDRSGSCAESRAEAGHQVRKWRRGRV
mmetsp:Transcript_9181/g.27632  ORF Transcript_9181/g.27632 Transcript_9181/m.27632 type:complete len:200 (-) Transcript_9181:1269-1868(-)